MMKLLGFVLCAVMVLAIGSVGCSPAPTEAPATTPPTEKMPAPAAEPAPAMPAPAPAAEPAPAMPAPAPAAEPAPATPAPAAEPAPASPSAAAPAPAGEPITAASIVGTKWDAGPYRLAFNADGKLKVNDALDGSWKIDGSKLDITINDQTYNAEIQGAKITWNGQELKRIVT